MRANEVWSPPSLKWYGVDQIESGVEQGRTDVQVSEHPGFSAVKKKVWTTWSKKVVLNATC